MTDGITTFGISLSDSSSKLKSVFEATGVMCFTSVLVACLRMYYMLYNGHIEYLMLA